MVFTNSEQYLKLTEQRLTRVFFAYDPELVEPICYTVLSGGKRFRPLLTIAGGQLNKAGLEHLLTVGCAFELIHCYSLVHDDLPAMDNDDLRRGVPTCHKKYDEATAILVGDALQAMAFELLSSPELKIPDDNRLKIINLAAKASGINGMVGGQMLDLSSTGQKLTLSQLQNMHSRKTGALIKAAILAGYLCGDSVLSDIYNQVGQIADSMGLLFQIIDDILDVTQSSLILGKTANKDAVNNKATYISLLGLEESKAVATELHAEIKTDLGKLANSAMLQEIADSIYMRNH